MELIGHENTKRRVSIALESALARNINLPHILLAGAAGCGKTTTAKWLSEVGDYDFMPVSPLELKTKKSVYQMLEALNLEGYDEKGNRVGRIKPTIVFFDEIHQMPTIGQEILGIAMESFCLDADVSNARSNSNQIIWLPYFTVVGATTDDGKLTKPFRDRFKLKFIYEPYKDEEMFEIAKYHAIKRKLRITKGAIQSIVNRSRGVPRIMVTNLENIRDVQIANKTPVIDVGVAEEAFDNMGIDPSGLNKVEIKILKTLMEAKTAIGLDNLSIVTNESSKTIVQTLEPFLIRKGLILRTGKGRQITEKGVKYLEDFGHLKGGSAPTKEFISATYERL